MEIIEENATNYLVKTSDGGTATKTKASDLNQLLYGQNLWGLLESGDEIWTKDGAEDEPDVTIIPDDNATHYTLRVGDAPDLTLGEHHKTDLVDALADVYHDHDGQSTAPLVDLYDSIRDNMVREFVLDPFLKAFTDKVGKRDDGWYINGHLLLTYEGEFYHPDNVSRNRSGRIIGEGTSTSAYKVDIDYPTEEIQREISPDGQTYRLTDSEVEFIAKAVWGIKNTPDRR